ncbi:MAG: TlpA disulfide reductase family protein [Pseudomonadota bacterium]|jgi:peroxiredoxin|nr:TlpA family protein disulfide reductase [Gammaproteobacteria bacterium]MBU1731089.1 TlpA family protein disulfide reductase [Gammaproteobacteria bacterium]MBU1894153.1 TlpA family protein disulfide reductase [Gammaproteobacteria bacterium]
MRAKKHVLIAIGILALVAWLALTLTQKPTAPQISLSTLEGKQISLESLRGKVVLVNFWATSCPGCIKEMPHLAETWRKYHDRGLEVVAVAMSYDPPEYVRNYTRQNALPFTIALDADGKAAQAFNQVKLTPTTFIIAKDGHIIQQTLGELDFVKLHALLEQQLGTS